MECGQYAGGDREAEGVKVSFKRGVDVCFGSNSIAPFVHGHNGIFVLSIIFSNF